MRWLALLPCLALVGPASGADLPTDARLRCEVTYGGALQVIEARPTGQPYEAPSFDIAGRFHFKPVLVQGAGLVERIAIYVYGQTPRQPVLIQHARFLPPYPQAPPGQPVEMTGEQRLYAGPLERELIYRCQLVGGQP